jgi:hypothetical protein
MIPALYAWQDSAHTGAAYEGVDDDAGDLAGHRLS